MYLFIFEDGKVKQASAVGDDDLESCDNGYLDIIDVSASGDIRRRWEGGWVEVESID